MSGRVAQRPSAEAEVRGEQSSLAISGNPDALEVAPGTAHEKLEGWIPKLAG